MISWQACPRWGLWSLWSECSATCGRGRISRSRECLGGVSGDIGCEGASNEQEICSLRVCIKLSSSIFKWSDYFILIQDCPQFTPWTDWSPCSLRCGRGVRSRGRACIDSNGDLSDGCVGPDLESVSCINGECPYWSDWTTWTLCEGPCGTQIRRFRSRTCINGLNGQEGCLGEGSEVGRCDVTVW